MERNNKKILSLKEMVRGKVTVIRRVHVKSISCMIAVMNRGRSLLWSDADNQEQGMKGNVTARIGGHYSARRIELRRSLRTHS